MEKTINGYKKSEAIEAAFTLGFYSEKYHYSCSQSSFHAITTVLGYKNPILFKTLAPFQGGGADTGLNSCGAYCGPLAFFGMLFGRDYALWEKREMDLKASLLGEKLLKNFHEAYGSALCKDIQMNCYGFSTRFLQDGQLDKTALKRFEDCGGHEIIAPTIVGRGAAWAIDIVWDELPKDQDTDLSSIPSMQEAERLFNEKIQQLSSTS